METDDQLDILEGMLATIKALQAIAQTMPENGPRGVVLEQVAILGKSLDSMLTRLKTAKKGLINV